MPCPLDFARRIAQSCPMTSRLIESLRSGRPIPWLAALIAGFVAPAAAMAMLAETRFGGGLPDLAGTILAVALMGAGMIAAAAAGRLGPGVGLALVCATALLLGALGLGLSLPAHPLATGLAFAIASISFAARGALFARSARDKGWWIAAGVIAGEAAVVFTALAQPDALPGWLLALLPAQWASAAIAAALTGTMPEAAIWELFALTATAAATLLVARLWPRRWPYIIMFTMWIGVSVLVLHRPPLTMWAPQDTSSQGEAPQTR